MLNEKIKPTTGIVLGKFMPLHQGHLYLLDFAQRYVDRLTIVMDSLAVQPIPAELRLRWLRESFGQATVVHLTEMPQDPAEHPDFWKIWREALLHVLPAPPDFVFASEPYGERVAAELSATFVPVDIGRDVLPVSGTAIRRAPLEHWRYLPRCVRPYYVKRVCIVGPESTGKTTLTKGLAAHFQTVAVPEYARTHLEAQGGQISYADIPAIARGQIASEDALAYNAERLMFCDTDLIMTTIWSDWLFGDCPAWIRAEADRRRYDLYLLTDVDVPWEADSVRYLPNDRRNFFERCVRELNCRDRSFVVLQGDRKTRFSAAIEAIEKLIHPS